MFSLLATSVWRGQEKSVNPPSNIFVLGALFSPSVYVVESLQALSGISLQRPNTRRKRAPPGILGSERPGPFLLPAALKLWDESRKQLPSGLESQ